MYYKQTPCVNPDVKYIMYNTIFELIGLWLLFQGKERDAATKSVIQEETLEVKTCI